MCDYSLMHVKSRPAAVADKLVTSGFIGSSSKGFRAPADCETVVCVLPGTEIAFSQPIVFRSRIEYGYQEATDDADRNLQSYRWIPPYETRPAQVAIFRQINLDKPSTHHDCIEFADGERVLLDDIESGIEATVLQLPAAPKTEAEAQEQKRLEVVS